MSEPIMPKPTEEEMNAVIERYMFERLLKNITPEVYDQLRSVLGEIASGVLCVVDEDWRIYCPHCKADIPGRCGPSDEKKSLPPLPVAADGYNTDLEKLATTFSHKEDCAVLKARHLLTLLPPRC